MPNDTQERIDDNESRIHAVEKRVNDLELEKNNIPNPVINVPLDPITKKSILTAVIYPISIRIQDAATAANYGVFFTADRPYNIVSVSAVWETACSSTGTLQIERLTGTQALDSGTALLAAAIALNGTANTVKFPSLSNVSALVMSRGDRLALKDASTLTSTVGLQVQVLVTPL